MSILFSFILPTHWLNSSSAYQLSSSSISSVICPLSSVICHPSFFHPIIQSSTYPFFSASFLFPLFYFHSSVAYQLISSLAHRLTPFIPYFSNHPVIQSSQFRRNHPCARQSSNHPVIPAFRQSSTHPFRRNLSTHPNSEGIIPAFRQLHPFRRNLSILFLTSACWSKA